MPICLKCDTLLCSNICDYCPELLINTQKAIEMVTVLLPWNAAPYRVIRATRPCFFRENPALRQMYDVILNNLRSNGTRFYEARFPSPLPATDKERRLPQCDLCPYPTRPCDSIFMVYALGRVGRLMRIHLEHLVSDVFTVKPPRFLERSRLQDAAIIAQSLNVAVT